jgi:hypothetical protein
VDDGRPGCDPTAEDEQKCVFRPFMKGGENDNVKCSLGYLPFLPSVKTYCDRLSSQFIKSPTKHNFLCSGKTAKEVIEEHPDFSMQAQSATKVGF